MSRHAADPTHRLRRLPGLGGQRAGYRTAYRQPIWPDGHKDRAPDLSIHRREGQTSGQVVIRVGITETGDVQSAEAISGDATLAQTAVDAAKQWKFKPYLKDRAPTKIAVSLPFAFLYLDEPGDRPAESFWRDVPRDLITVRIAEGAPEAMIAHKVEPEYPPIAMTPRIQGNVLLFVVIGKDDAVHDVRVIDGHPLLRQASIDAVVRWRYKPVLLDGRPIDAQTVILVRYMIGG
jgi:TonB family protein